MPEIIPTIAVVVIRDDQVLLVKHGEAAGHLTGIYGLPSGHIENGETEEEASVRELREETGLRTTIAALVPLPKTYLATIQRKDGVKTFSWKVFRATKFEGELVSTSETTPEWIGISDLSKYTLLPNVAEAIHEALTL